MSLLTFNKNGIYCEKADVYIDPWRKVEKALITHGHSDHARHGHKHYLCTHSAKPVIQYRLGQKMKIESVGYGEKVVINGVQFSFHPAGHIIGSAQIRVEYKGEVWVASGDYKIEDDGISEAFELVKCHSFITETTFGLPVYKWQPQEEIFEDINNWWYENSKQGIVSVITAYSLGKAQRLLHNVDHSIGNIYTHGSIEKVNEIIRDQGIDLPDSHAVTSLQTRDNYRGALLITPGSTFSSEWIKRFEPFTTAAASGWMQLRSNRRNRSVDRGFVLSDHADWDGLNETIVATGAEQVFVTHGYTRVFAKWLKGKGINAKIVSTEFSGEQNELEEINIKDSKAVNSST